jgi:hypothetical protein
MNLRHAAALAFLGCCLMLRGQCFQCVHIERGTK